MIYLDPPFKAQAKHQSTPIIWRHFWVDAEDELHYRARLAGLKRQWHQRGRWSHYDVYSPTIIQKLLKMGAVVTDRYGPAYHVACLSWDGAMIDRIHKIRRRNAKAKPDTYLDTDKGILRIRT